MKINDLFKNNNGDVVRVAEIDDVRKTVMIEFEDGKTKNLSFSTLKDKRRWTLVDIKAEELKIAAYEAETDYVAEVMQQKKDLGIECPEITEAPELVPMPGAEKLADLKEEYCADGTAYSEVGKEIAEQAAEKAAKKSSKKNLIEYNGKALTLHGWSKELSVPFGTLYARVTRFNWTYEEALSGVKNK